MENKNPKLTIDEVRASGDFGHISDEEVQNIVDSLYELSLILYDHYIKE